MERILGQDRALESLRRQLRAGRVHHAFVFHGPAGVGKFTTAQAFARVLLCHRRDAAQPEVACGDCDSCRLLAPAAPRQRPEGAGRGRTARSEPREDESALVSPHPDLHVVTKELARYSDDADTRNRKLTSIPVEVLRHHLIEPASHTPQMADGRYGKVFIVDESELLAPAGQNVLLKTLEEPPGETGATTFILVTSSEDRLLPTIRSRCQRIAFLPLPDEQVRQWLRRHHPEALEGESQQFDWLIAFAGGSPGRAALALEHGLIDWARRIHQALEAAGRGHPDGELGAALLERIDGFAKAWVDAHKNASKEAANKMAADLAWSIVLTSARQRLYHLAKDLTPGDLEAGEARLEPWARVIDAVSEAQQLIGHNVNLGVVCDHLASQIAQALTPAPAAH